MKKMQEHQEFRKTTLKIKSTLPTSVNIPEINENLIKFYQAKFSFWLIGIEKIPQGLFIYKTLKEILGNQENKDQYFERFYFIAQSNRKRKTISSIRLPVTHMYNFKLSQVQRSVDNS